MKNSLRLLSAAFTLSFVAATTHAEAGNADLDQARAQLDQARAQVDAAAAQIQQGNVQLEMANTSPGWVGKADQTPKLNIDFPGGTLKQLLDLLSTKNFKVNLIAQENPSAVSLPPFSLQDVSHWEVLRTIALIVYNSSSYQLIPLGENLADLKLKHDGNAAPDFRAWDISGILKSLSIDDVIDAIRTACSMNPAIKFDDLQIKYHPRTNLLLVKGPPDALVVVGQMVDALRFRHFARPVHSDENSAPTVK